ncbi:carboxypeptidase B [Folsomia candida]|uniref:Zinc carboxypeptidase A 1 n=1 Tax=Folsomia candida TaxID=158441 RepID=A0A226DVS5_FOLCA|nr:carboxypeptidase B [Folsomia candida]OXA49575.1 Carboxypeptidase A5 [Folsomia candida]
MSSPKFLLILVALSAVAASSAKYSGYVVIRATPTSQQHLAILRQLDTTGLYDFWAGPFKIVGQSCDIMVSPKQKGDVVATLKAARMSHFVMIDDVEILLQDERNRLDAKQSGNMTWTEYHRMDTIYAWMDGLVAANPNLVSIETYGSSNQGKPLKVLKVSTGGSNKPAFWIDSAIHAREWISPAVNTYIMNDLIHNINHANLRAGIDFYFAPLINPDGYEYTFTTDRMWRKSRSTNVGSACIGTDVNRNFGFKWGVDNDGSSPNPCTETHRGADAYSEPEADHVNNYISGKANSTNWTAFITLHSYSQLWMSPYGWSDQAADLPADLAELVAVSNQCVAALTAVHGTQYQTGAASQILYKSNGSSRDWAKGDGGFKWVYTIELRDTGRYGFVLPPEQILPTAQETWAGVQVLARHILTK